MTLKDLTISELVEKHPDLFREGARARIIVDAIRGLSLIQIDDLDSARRFADLCAMFAPSFEAPLAPPSGAPGRESGDVTAEAEALLAEVETLRATFAPVIRAAVEEYDAELAALKTAEQGYFRRLREIRTKHVIAFISESGELPQAK